MDRTDLTSSLYLCIIGASFENPSQFPHLVGREVTRNRSLRSHQRRELTELLYEGLRWRRRIWGSIPPSSIDFDDLEKRLEEARVLVEAPPLARWNQLSRDELARELSFPVWLVNLWIDSLGFETAVRLILNMNRPAPTTLRTNELKTTRPKLRKELSKEGIETTEGTHSPWALHLKKRRNLRSVLVYQKGHFEIQDEGSQLAVLESEAKEGQTIFDACTGGGGKALALAGLLKNHGKIVASDADSRKLDELKKRARRGGVRILDIRWVGHEDPDPLPEMKDQCDVVFVDVPCSGLGTLRRHPWRKWELSTADLFGFPPHQYGLLRRFADFVKPGGKLVYVTCTINSNENEDVAKTFVAESDEFEFAKPPRTLRPDLEGTDGFFVSVLQRSVRSLS